MFFRRSIKDKRVIVTGASSGIGRAIALELARQRARVIVTARREERLLSLVQEMRAFGGQANFVNGDITEEELRRRLLEAAKDRFGGVDILINNAGITGAGRFDEASRERLRQLFEVNVFAVVELTRLALPMLKQGSQPLVVNVGSACSYVALPNLAEYSATKFAIRGFSEALRAELHHDGIGVLLVCPGTVETEIWTNMIEETGQTSWRARRGATPEFIARSVVWAMRRGSHEICPDLQSGFAHYASRLCPAVVAAVLARRN